MKEVSEIAFEVTKTINNIKNHDFSVADYKLCKNEADYVLEALDMYLQSIKFDDIGVEVEKSIDDAWENAVDCLSTWENPT